MRKMLVALLLVLALTLSLGQEKALADCSNEKINTGAATVVTQLSKAPVRFLVGIMVRSQKI